MDLRAESHTNTRDLFCAAFRGIRLSNKDGFFGTSDPFIVASRYSTIELYDIVLCLVIYSMVYKNCIVYIYIYIYILFSHFVTIG